MDEKAKFIITVLFVCLVIVLFTYAMGKVLPADNSLTIPYRWPGGW